MLLTLDPTASSLDIGFDTLPVNQTVTEGGDATFACSGTVDGAPVRATYRIRDGAVIALTVGGNISNLSQVNGIDSALVFGEYNSQLLLRGITREANGYTVACAVLVGALFREAMNAPLAFIKVTCEYNG